MRMGDPRGNATKKWALKAPTQSSRLKVVACLFTLFSLRGQNHAASASTPTRLRCQQDSASLASHPQSANRQALSDLLGCDAVREPICGVRKFRRCGRLNRYAAMKALATTPAEPSAPFTCLIDGMGLVHWSLRLPTLLFVGLCFIEGTVSFRPLYSWKHSTVESQYHRRPKGAQQNVAVRRTLAM